MTAPDAATAAASPPATRTQDEILARIAAITDADMLGFRREVLIEALDFEHATRAGVLQPAVTAAAWADAGGGKTDEQLRSAAADYLEFAFGKARTHRGISACRSVDKLAEYAWLLGRDGLVAEMRAADHAQYGVPALLTFAGAFDLPVPDGEDLIRMGRGEECEPGCEQGCEP